MNEQSRHGKGLSWTKEDDEILARLWCSGIPASKIVDTFPGRTKNAIIGRVHRLRLDRIVSDTGGPRIRARPKSKRSHPFIPKAPIVVPEPKPAPLPTKVSDTPEGGIAFMALRSHHCRSIIDSHGAPDGLALYCGGQVAEGRSFCPYHASIYYRPAPQRLRGRY